MDMSHTPEVPELDELERERAERVAARRAPATATGYLGTGTLAQRMRTVIAAQTLLVVGNGLLAASALPFTGNSAPVWVFTLLAALTLGSAGVAWFARQLIQQDLVLPLQSAAASAVELADGNHDVAVDNADRQDEIGDIARALLTIKKAAHKFQKLQAQTEADRESHFATLRKLTEGFEKNVSEIVGSVASASSELQATATAMAACAEQSANQSSRVSMSHS
jgi:methyl-accepting chemotaxis protein